MKIIGKLGVVLLVVLVVFSAFNLSVSAIGNDEAQNYIAEDTGKVKTFDECLEDVKYATRFLIGGVIEMPTAVSIISIATPLIVFLPLSLPVSAVAGVGASLIGIINILFIPLEALIMYMVQ